MQILNDNFTWQLSTQAVPWCMDTIVYTERVSLHRDKYHVDSNEFLTFDCNAGVNPENF